MPNDKYDKNGFDENGYNRLGFDKFGYNKQGFDKDGYDRRGYNSAGFHKLTGFNKDGFDKDGFDTNGFNIAGYDREGFNRDGFNYDGYDRSGFNHAGFDINGYDRTGYNAEGYNKYGFDRFGYDKDGFDADGYSKEGYNKEGFNRQGYNQDGFNSEGYDSNGFNRLGFDKNGFNARGFDTEGYNKAGFNEAGFDRNGYDEQGYNKDGFDAEGYNKAGYNLDGYDRKGFDYKGFDKNGFDKNGFNSEGYNRFGFDRNGYNAEGFDKYGFAASGYDKDGFNILGRNEQGYGIDGYNESGFNREGFNKDGFHKDDFDENGFNKYTGFNSKGYDRDGYNINGLDASGYDREGFDFYGIDKNGYGRDGYNLDGYDRNGYDHDGFNRSGFDKLGYDKSGYNKDGFDRQGYNRLGFDIDGYDKNGLNASGKRTALITNINQLKGGLRIKRKSGGARGRIDTVGGTSVFYTMDENIGTNIKTHASIESFMDMFLLDDDDTGNDRERESLYHTIVRRYLQSDYLNTVLIPKEQSKTNPREIKYIDRSGFIATMIKGRDKLQIKLDAQLEARRIANEAYFAHVDYKNNPDLYIGKIGLPGYVVDWADKQAAYYYEYKIYTSNPNLGINFVRDISIKNGVFSDFHDLFNRQAKPHINSNARYANIADERLIEIIERNRSSKSIHDIVESIQTKQYEIIAQDINSSQLILGCAGSGKTMIMLHRIRYLLFNNQDIDANSMIVVSPTDILGKESEELAKILRIDRINQCSTIEFYIDIIRNIFNSNGMFNRIEEFQLCDSAKEVDAAAISSCVDIIKKKHMRKQYVSTEYNTLSLEKEQLLSDIDDTIMQNGNPYYLRAIKELSSYSKNDIVSIIGYAKTTIETELPIKQNRKNAISLLLNHLAKKQSKRDGLDEIKIRRSFKRIMQNIDTLDSKTFEFLYTPADYPITRFAQIISLLSGNRNAKEIKQIIDDVKGLSYSEIEHMAYLIDRDIEQLKRISIIQEALEYALNTFDYTVADDKLNTVSNKDIINSFENLYMFMQIVNQTCIEKGVNPFVLFGSFNDINNDMRRLENANQSNDYVFDMLVSQLHIVRNRADRKIVINKHQLQKMLHIMLNMFGTMNQNKHYIFLDEFQDYSPEELKDIRAFFQNSIINLYGDVNQCIYTNGINSVNELNRIMAFNRQYELNENYRTASDITEYVNKRFGVNMYKIGLPGSVKESNKLFLQKLNNNDRGAIIIADETILKEMDFASINVDVHYYKKGDTIHRNVYNVLSVSQAKGLEFEHVVVIDKNMTKNQLYVACTRAIRSLEIVKMT